MVASLQKIEPIKRQDLVNIFETDRKMNDTEIKGLLQLLNRYPKPPTPEEVRQAATLDDRKNVEDTIHNMFDEQDVLTE